MPAADFFESYLSTTIGADEILTDIRLPGLPPSAAVAFLEISRRYGDFAIVAAAAVIDLGAGGEIAEARIALGGVGPRPVRARVAERLLVGQRPTAALLAEAAVGLAVSAGDDGLSEAGGLAADRLATAAPGLARDRCVASTAVPTR